MIADGITSLSLGPQHGRIIAFAAQGSQDDFPLDFIASADQATHAGAPYPDYDTILRGGRAAWLRASTDHQDIKIGLWSNGDPYSKGSYLYPGNKSPASSLVPSRAYRNWCFEQAGLILARRTTDVFRQVSLIYCRRLLPKCRSVEALNSVEPLQIRRHMKRTCRCPRHPERRILYSRSANGRMVVADSRVDEVPDAVC